MEEIWNENLERISKSVKDKFRESFFGVVILGSCGRDPGEMDIGSDLDLLFLLSPNIHKNEPPNLLRRFIKQTWQEDEVLLLLVTESKIILYLRHRGFKIDLGFAWSLEENPRYLLGSEHCRVLVENSPSVGLEKQLEEVMAVPAVRCLSDYSPEYQEVRFLEMYELLCKSIYRKDLYRVEFYGFVIRHALVVLERIAAGEKEHLYLPKMAFAIGNESQIAQLPILSGHSESLWADVQKYASLFLRLFTTKGHLQDYGRFLEEIQAKYEHFHDV